MCIILCICCVYIFQMDVEGKKGEGYKPYYTHKTENLQVIISEKMQDLRRLQAQRNELNAKGNYTFITCSSFFFPVLSHEQLFKSTAIKNPENNDNCFYSSSTS